MQEITLWDTGRKNDETTKPLALSIKDANHNMKRSHSGQLKQETDRVGKNMGMIYFKKVRIAVSTAVAAALICGCAAAGTGAAETAQRPGRKNGRRQVRQARERSCWKGSGS